MRLSRVGVSYAGHAPSVQTGPLTRSRDPVGADIGETRIRPTRPQALSKQAFDSAFDPWPPCVRRRQAGHPHSEQI